MKLPGYFINHPVIALVLNCLLLMVGFLSLKTLALREYPNLNFPTITVSTSYPNASSPLVESTVTNTLEEQLAGIQGLDTIISESNPGSSYIKLQFKNNISMDSALTATQDAVNLVKPSLPSKAKLPQVERQKKTNGLPFIAIALESTSLNFGELTHYANLHLKNNFRSIKGVSSVEVWGEPYIYEISLIPKKLFSFGVNVDDVIDVINKSHVSLPAGNYRQTTPSTLNFELKERHDFENLLVKMNKNHPIFLKSIANVRLTTDRNETKIRVNGHPGLVLSINRADDANPLEVSSLVHEEVKRILKNLPPTIQAKIIIDQSNFIKSSIKNIRSSIIEAIVLVLCIVFLFLSNYKATLIPLISIPISLVGSLIFLKFFGFSLNIMTLLAMVLAVGLVVDDAIIVLENIYRHIEKGSTPLLAAIQGSNEIGFAIVAMTLTLAAVYIPLAFVPGMLGQFFIEFAVALAGSVFISGVVSLTLSPVMCAYLLKKKQQTFWSGFQLFQNQLEKYHLRFLKKIIHKKKMMIVFFAISMSLCFVFYSFLAKETAPKEDRGLISVYIPKSVSENMASLDKKITQVENKINSIPEVINRLAFVGDWGGSIVLPLKDNKDRTRTATEITHDIEPKLSDIPSLNAHVWSWDTGLPGINDPGVGSELTAEISTTDDFSHFANELEQFKKVLDKTDDFFSSNFDLQLDSLGYQISLDNNTLSQLKLTPRQVAKTIEVFFSGDKASSFQKDGIKYHIVIKGTHSPWSLNELYLTPNNGKPVSLGAFTQMKPITEPPRYTHYNQMRSTQLTIKLKKGVSLKAGMDSLLRVSQQNLPSSYQLNFEGKAKAYQKTSQDMFYLFILSILFIFAILSIQFENFIDPLIILFTVPLASFGALAFTFLFGQSFNIYTEVGLITLVGLITKHGILIVEFANNLLKTGISLEEAILKATVLRLRPILMTTGAMLFGTFPLILFHDAGYESRHVIGITLIGGLSLGTFLTLFIIPTVYFWVKSIVASFSRTQGDDLKANDSQIKNSNPLDSIPSPSPSQIASV